MTNKEKLNGVREILSECFIRMPHRDVFYGCTGCGLLGIIPYLGRSQVEVNESGKYYFFYPLFDDLEIIEGEPFYKVPIIARKIDIDLILQTDSEDETSIEVLETSSKVNLEKIRSLDSEVSIFILSNTKEIKILTANSKTSKEIVADIISQGYKAKRSSNALIELKYDTEETGETIIRKICQGFLKTQEEEKMKAVKIVDIKKEKRLRIEEEEEKIRLKKIMKKESENGIDIAIFNSDDIDEKRIKSLTKEHIVVMVIDEDNKYCEIFSQDLEGVDRIMSMLEKADWIRMLSRKNNRIEMLIKQMNNFNSVKNVIFEHFYTQEEVKNSHIESQGAAEIPA